MAEKILNTRLQLRIDTYANWTNDTLGENKGANLVLKRGEIGLCEIPSGNAAATTAPTVLFKVGTYDGENAETKKKFSELKWASALAADVYSWAKSETAELVEVEEGEGNAKVTKQYLQFKTGTSVNHAIDLSSFATDAEVEEIRATLAAADSDMAARIDTIYKVAGETKSGALADEITRAIGAETTLGERINDLIGGDADTAQAETIAGAKAFATAAVADLADNQVAENARAIAAMDAAYKAADGALANKITNVEGKLANVSNVMDFIGTRTVSVSEGVITVTAIDNETFNKGDVVVDNGGKEYVYDGETWHEFGYADANSTAIETLRSDLTTTTKTANDAKAAASANTASIDNITKNNGVIDTKIAALSGENGVITVLTARVAANEQAIATLDNTYVSDAEFSTFKKANTGAINEAAAAAADAAARINAYDDRFGTKDDILVLYGGTSTTVI